MRKEPPCRPFPCPTNPASSSFATKAKDLRRAVLAGEPEALAEVGQQPLIDLLEPLTTPEPTPQDG